MPWLASLREQGLLRPLGELAARLEREDRQGKYIFGEDRLPWAEMVREEFPTWTCENCLFRGKPHLGNYVETGYRFQPWCRGGNFPKAGTCPAYLGQDRPIPFSAYYRRSNEEVPEVVSGLGGLEEAAARIEKRKKEWEIQTAEKAAEKFRRALAAYQVLQGADHPLAHFCKKCVHHKVGESGEKACGLGNARPASTWGYYPHLRAWVREDGLRVPRCSHFRYKSLSVLPVLPAPEEQKWLLQMTARRLLDPPLQESPFDALSRQAGGLKEFLESLPAEALAGIIYDRLMEWALSQVLLQGRRHALGPDGEHRWEVEEIDGRQCIETA